MNSLKLSFLQISPKVWADKNYLYARTSLFYRFLNLFFYSRTVAADRVKKQIEIKVKTFWFLMKTKYIAFNDIKYIDMEKGRNAADEVFSLQPSGVITERWYVKVILKNNPYPEILFRFIGHGGAHGYWDNLRWFDFAGMQYEKALNYAELVSKYTGANLFRDTKIEYTGKADQYKCLKCGHVSPSEIKCMYCGSREMEKAR